MKEVTGDALERRVATSLAPALGASADTRRADDGRRALRELAPRRRRRRHRAPRARRLPAARDEALVAMREAVRAALGREDIR